MCGCLRVSGHQRLSPRFARCDGGSAPHDPPPCCVRARQPDGWSPAAPFPSAEFRSRAMHGERPIPSSAQFGQREGFRLPRANRVTWGRREGGRCGGSERRTRWRMPSPVYWFHTPSLSPLTREYGPCMAGKLLGQGIGGKLPEQESSQTQEILHCGAIVVKGRKFGIVPRSRPLAEHVDAQLHHSVAGQHNLHEM